MCLCYCVCLRGKGGVNEIGALTRALARTCHHVMRLGRPDPLTLHGSDIQKDTGKMAPPLIATFHYRMHITPSPMSSLLIGLFQGAQAIDTGPPLGSSASKNRKKRNMKTDQ